MKSMELGSISDIDLRQSLCIIIIATYVSGVILASIYFGLTLVGVWGIFWD